MAAQNLQLITTLVTLFLETYIQMSLIQANPIIAQIFLTQKRNNRGNFAPLTQGIR